MESENLRSASRAVNKPVGSLKNSEDMVALHGFKRLTHRMEQVMATIGDLSLRARRR